MHNIIEGVARYQREVFPGQRELFRQLREGQHPRALFIGCSDSRIDPSLITQTEPGELFVLQNPGNIVPPYGASDGSEASTVEFAVVGLEIEHIIVCGHHHCGAMRELVHREYGDGLPATTAWLRHAAPVQDALARHDRAVTDDLVLEAVRLNVLLQMANLRTHPSVADRLARERLTIHGWIYDFETADIQTYDVEQHDFVSLVDQHCSE